MWRDAVTRNYVTYTCWDEGLWLHSSWSQVEAVPKVKYDHSTPITLKTNITHALIPCIILHRKHCTIRTITVDLFCVEATQLFSVQPSSATSNPSQGTSLQLTTRNAQYRLTDNLALGATVMSRIGSHISVVEKNLPRMFSSNAFPSRKNVTEPMFRWVSLAVSFETFLFLSTAGSFGGFTLKLDIILGARSRSIKLPWRFSDL